MAASTEPASRCPACWADKPSARRLCDACIAAYAERDPVAAAEALAVARTLARTLEGKLGAARARGVQLDQQKKELEVNRAQLESKIRDLEATLAEAEATAQAAQALADDGESYQREKPELDRSRASLAAEQATIARERKEAAELAKRHSVSEAERQELRERIDRLQSEARQREAEATRKQEELESLRREQGRWLAEEGHLKAAIGSKALELDRLTRVAERAGEEALQARQHAERLEKAAQEARGTLEAERGLAQAELAGAVERVRATQAALEAERSVAQAELAGAVEKARAEGLNAGRQEAASLPAPATVPKPDGFALQVGLGTVAVLAIGTTILFFMLWRGRVRDHSSPPEPSAKSAAPGNLEDAGPARNLPDAGPAGNLPDAAPARNLPDVKLDWVRLEGGPFTMGRGEDTDEKPHAVTVPAFKLSRTEVTVAQYRACVEAKVCSKPGEGPYCNWGKDDRGQHPVNCVSYDDAVKFAEWAKARLPTEAEWEYAARSGGKDKRYPWGPVAPDCERAVMDKGGKGCGMNSTWPVCSKAKGNTEQGLCDMAGNVWEWVRDCYEANYDQTPKNGGGHQVDKCSGARVVRGGSWNLDVAVSFRCANRNRGDPTGRGFDVGFRVAVR